MLEYVQSNIRGDMALTRDAWQTLLHEIQGG